MTDTEDQRLYHERIVADPRILAGKPVVKGTRIAVDLVLEELAQNPDIDELLAAHPDLTRDGRAGLPRVREGDCDRRGGFPKAAEGGAV